MKNEQPYTDEEFEQECSKIRAEYQWLEERTIEHFARVALTNKYKHDKD